MLLDAAGGYLLLRTKCYNLTSVTVLISNFIIAMLKDLAVDATAVVGVEIGQGLREVDVKKYIKVEKVPGGQLEDSKVKGVMINKDVIAPGKMRIKNVNLRITLLDCPLEYKKVIVNRADELQESDVGTGVGLFEVKKIGDEFFAFIVDCKDSKACTVLLRGASNDLLNEVERNLQQQLLASFTTPHHLQKFHPRHAKTPSTPKLQLHQHQSSINKSRSSSSSPSTNIDLDAISAAINIIKHPKLVPGGGAVELTVITISAMLKQKSSSVEGIEKWPYEAAPIAFEAIPRTLAQNCGVNVIRTMSALQGKVNVGVSKFTVNHPITDDR
nr:T-complex protein 1 subunit gamma [Ipomoea batatas]